ncbi:UDP-glucose/GDP-mannose dehydrogenase family protein [Motiliproteus sp. MSK22-1]|uniref:UDP-glucose dehydrogenase family protein n=1 Tax=Motiliproteus sp. MSK22-1 TaxID=1897630 RepID=UPI000977EA04|nr:UDP-glucose/GDP-mannose dehydrogenase family protein [Motiliproteus sp. MSK22-1]OMH30902.1 UDP-glucose 6-dehydrogenase [Motiliproteus sp. MSK22-1]
MKVSIFGTGYVGLVTGACLAESGRHVCCVDIDERKIDALTLGDIPIYEPGLKNYVQEGIGSGRLVFTNDARSAIKDSDVIFIAVGTPPDEDGSADLKHVLDVARTVGRLMDDSKTIVTKSTVPVGTADKVRIVMEQELEKRSADISFFVASNPEFLKEGNAVGDFMKPDRIIVGTDSEVVREQMRELYAPFNRMRDKLIFMDIRSAELTKYAANAMLATKISFMNEIANLAERLGADIESVRNGIGSDPRIGYHFIYPGCGYGGSCFPKDVNALERTAYQHGYKAELLTAVESINKRQKEVLYQKISSYFNGKLEGKCIAIWGLAFKPNTDDMREAPSRTLMEALWQKGARVRAYDPEALEEARRIYGERSDLELVDNQEQALEGADALAICTEWKSFWAPDFQSVKGLLNSAVIFDGRNLYDPQLLKDLGFDYYGIGRGDG